MVTRSRSRLSCLAGVLVVVGAPIGFCVWTEVLPTRTLNRVYAALRPGLTVRETVVLLSELAHTPWIVMIDQHDANGTSIELLSSSRPGRNARELDAVAARVTANDLVWVFISTHWGTIRFEILFDAGGKVAFVSPQRGQLK